MGTVFGRCKTIVGSASQLYVGKRKLHTTAELFEFLTGCGASVGRKNQRLHEEKKAVPHPEKKGPKPSNVDERFEGFYDWVVEKIESAKKGGWVTLDSLKRDLSLERSLTVSKRVLRRTLRKLGFRYVRRVGKWFSRRHEERIQRRLWDFLEWAVGNSSKVGGKFVWNIPVAFQDETNINDGEFRQFSICAPESKGSGKLDRGFDQQKKGKGVRVNVLHCIFSHIDQPTAADGSPECMEAWKSTWTGKNHKYKGATVTGPHVEQFFQEHVFHRMAGGAVCLDNAQTHKAYTAEMAEMGEAELCTLIEEKTANGKKGSYRGDFVRKEFEKLIKDAPFGLVGFLTESQLRSFVRRHHLFDTELYAQATAYNVARLIYLPQYYPECNPIERYWALLKRYYYDTDPCLQHKSRLAQALARIPDDYVEKCFHKSLEWVWAKHAEMKKLRVLGPREGDVVGDEELMSGSEAESDGSSS